MSTDPEIAAMQAVTEALASLGEDRDAIARVLQWAAARQSIALTGASKAALSNTHDSGTSGFIGQAPSDLPDLFTRASPSTESDKALVVGYWLQKMQGKSDVEGFEVNKELKNLGHSASNITRALGALMKIKPALVIQTRKQGTSKQARKKYRLTQEGIRKVERMLSGTADDDR